MSPQSGLTAVVTGTGGLGFETALALAQAGADVIIAGRNPDKGAVAVAAIKRSAPQASVSFERLDLSELGSVAAFGERLRTNRTSLDVLVNNAAVMAPPKRQVTTDGFELQIGTNYLGHFALTAHLLPLLKQAPNPRVVTLSSIAARRGTIDFDDLQAERRYAPMSVYSQSKLACLMFALELQRRSEAKGWSIASIAAHPGIARTNLIPNSNGPLSPFGLAHTFFGFLLQSAARGALPTLFAVSSAEAKGGGYYGPDRLNETRGAPAVAAIPPQALDAGTARRLWEVSEGLTGTRLA